VNPDANEPVTGRSHALRRAVRRAVMIGAGLLALHALIVAAVVIGSR
jgi:hypothetical protein